METRVLELPKTAKLLHMALKKRLRAAVDNHDLASTQAQVESDFRLVEPSPTVAKQLTLSKHGRAFVIGIVDKNQSRTKEAAHFIKSDDSWFDCSFTVVETPKGLELAAYSFEIRYCAGMGVPFVRYDLNLPGHENQLRDLRCHFHPGNDDLILPAPLLSPLEALEFCILPPALNSSRKPRTPTAFEVDWLAASYRMHCERRL